MHIWSQFGYFDRALCPVKFNYGQTLANFVQKLSIVHDGYHEHWCVYVCLHVCMYVYLFVFPHPSEQAIKL